MSDDGTMAVVVIALLGNPFSPAYASARRRRMESADALSFSSMNVAIYARGASAWTLQEERVSPNDRHESGLSIGRSSMQWEGDGDKLVVQIDAHTTPLGKRISGRIVLHPEAMPGIERTIDPRGEHRWWPIAPLARVEVDFSAPNVHFSGHGYHDANAGDVPLEATFDTWSWSRARASTGAGAGESALLTYDVTCASGAERSLAMKISASGEVEDIERSWLTPLPRSRWGVERIARVDQGHGGRVLRSLEDGPFYSRSLIETQLAGRPVIAMHETLAARRLRQRWVRVLTEFRMRRLR